MLHGVPADAHAPEPDQAQRSHLLPVLEEVRHSCCPVVAIVGGRAGD
jgi:hypothetical protein